MKFIWNLLALIGLVAVIGLGYLVKEFAPDLQAMRDLDPGAKGVYLEMWTKLRDSGNTADATVWKVPLEDGVTPDDAEEAMKSVANELNIKGVGELPLSEQVELMTGEKQRFLKIYQYCNPLTAVKMVDFSDAFSAYLPCRIALVEAKDGSYALYSLNMDMMISGGKTLPPELLAEAQDVKRIIQEVMQRGAAGDF